VELNANHAMLPTVTNVTQIINRTNTILKIVYRFNAHWDKFLIKTLKRLIILYIISCFSVNATEEKQ